MNETQTTPAEAPPPVDLRPHVVAYLANNLRTNGYEHHARTMEALADLRASDKPSDADLYACFAAELGPGDAWVLDGARTVLARYGHAAPRASAEVRPLSQYGYQTLFDAISVATWTVASGDIEVSVQAFRDALKSAPAAEDSAKGADVAHLADDTRVCILADSSYLEGVKTGYSLGQFSDEAKYQQIVCSLSRQLREARAALAATKGESNE